MDKELIIKVIIEDIRYNRFIDQLEGIGLVVDPKHHSGLMWVVAEMMGNEKPSDKWCEEYMELMDNSELDIFELAILIKNQIFYAILNRESQEPLGTILLLAK